MLGLVAMGVVLAAAPAREVKPLADAMTVEPGATCLDGARLVEHAELWLERTDVDSGIAVTVEGDAEDRRTVRFVIARDGAQADPRVLSGIPGDCAELHAAVALAIAVAIDTTVFGDAFAPPPPVDPPVEPEVEDPLPVAEPTPTATAPPEPPRVPEPRRVSVATRFDGTVGIGLTDGPAYGGAAALVLRIRIPLDVEAAVFGLAGPHGELDNGRVNSTVLAGALRACGRPSTPSVVLRACAGLGAGALHVSGRGFAQPRRSVVPWVALGPSFGIEVPARSVVAFAASVEMWVPLVRARLVGLGPQGAVAVSQALPPVAGTLSLGPIFRFSR